MEERKPTTEDIINDMSGKVNDIWRWVYGDPVNKIDGAVDREKAYNSFYRKSSFLVKKPLLTAAGAFVFVYLTTYIPKINIESAIEILIKFL